MLELVKLYFGGLNVQGVYTRFWTFNNKYFTFSLTMRIIDMTWYWGQIWARGSSPNTDSPPKSSPSACCDADYVGSTGYSATLYRLKRYNMLYIGPMRFKLVIWKLIPCFQNPGWLQPTSTTQTSSTTSTFGKHSNFFLWDFYKWFTTAYLFIFCSTR